MTSLNGFIGNVSGNTAGTGFLEAKSGWYVYVTPRGGHAAAAGVASPIVFDSASVASRFSVNDWIEVGTATSKIVQVSAVSGTSIAYSGSAVTVSLGDRILRIGSTQPVVSSGNATYQPNTTIRSRDDSGGTVVSNSKLTTDANGMYQFWASDNFYDLLGQDANGSNQFIVPDIQVGLLTSFTDKGIYDVRSYGAVGDGATNDFAAINSAIQAAGSSGTVFFPPGSYYTTSGLSSSKANVVLQGAAGSGFGHASGSTTWRAASEIISDQTIVLFTYGSTSTATIRSGVRIRDLGFRDSSAGNNQVQGAIRIYRSENNEFRDVGIDNITTGFGIQFDGTGDFCQYSTIYNPHIWNVKTGIQGVTTTNGVNIFGGQVSCEDIASSRCITVTGGDTWGIWNTALHNAPVTIALSDHSYARIMARLEQVSDHSPNTGTGIQITSTGALLSRGNAMLGSIFTNHATAVSIGTAVHNTSIIGCGFNLAAGNTEISDAGVGTNVINTDAGQNSRIGLGYRNIAGTSFQTGFFGSNEGFQFQPLLFTPQDTSFLIRDSIAGYSGGLALGIHDNTHAAIGIGIAGDPQAFKASGATCSGIQFFNGQINLFGKTGMTYGNAAGEVAIMTVTPSGTVAVHGPLGVTGVAGFSGSAVFGATVTHNASTFFNDFSGFGTVAQTTLTLGAGTVFGLSTTGATTISTITTASNTGRFAIFISKTGNATITWAETGNLQVHNPNYLMTDNESIQFICDGVTWYQTAANTIT